MQYNTVGKGDKQQASSSYHLLLNSCILYGSMWVLKTVLEKQACLLENEEVNWDINILT